MMMFKQKVNVIIASFFTLILIASCGGKSDKSAASADASDSGSKVYVEAMKACKEYEKAINEAKTTDDIDRAEEMFEEWYSLSFPEEKIKAECTGEEIAKIHGYMEKLEDLRYVRSDKIEEESMNEELISVRAALHEEADAFDDMMDAADAAIDAANEAAKAANNKDIQRSVKASKKALEASSKEIDAYRRAVTY